MTIAVEVEVAALQICTWLALSMLVIATPLVGKPLGPEVGPMSTAPTVNPVVFGRIFVMMLLPAAVLPVHLMVIVELVRVAVAFAERWICDELSMLATVVPL